MKGNRDYMPWIVFAFVLVMAGLAVIQGYMDKGDYLKPGDPTPEATFTRLDGTPVKMSSFKGKVILVDFWATWCRVCISSMGKLQRLYNRFRRRNFSMLSINIEPKRKQMVQQWLKKKRYDFPVVFDHKRKGQRAFKTYRFPTLYLISANGEIRKVYTGFADEKTLARDIESLLTG